MAENDGLIEALTRENELFGQLTAERREAEDAEDALRLSAKSAADEHINALTKRQGEIITTAQEQQRLLEQLQADAAALAEVTSRPLWRELLPLTRLVDPQSTPTHIHARMQSTKAQLDAALAKDAVDKAKFDTGTEMRATKLRRQAMEVEAETTDVERIRRTLDDVKISRDRRRELVDLEISRVSPEELAKLEAAGTITGEERRQELQTRELRDIQLTSQRLVLQAQQVEQLSDEQLEGRTDRMAIDERNRRADEERTRDASKIAALQTKMSRADDAELLDMLTRREITSREYEAEMATRESQQLALTGQRQTVERGKRTAALDKLASLPEEEMDEFVKSNPEVTAEDARQIRTERLTNTLNVQSKELEVVQRTYEAADPPERERMVKAGVVSKTFAKQVANNERNQEIASAQYELQLGQQKMAAAEQSKGLYVDSLNLNQLDELITSANQRGGQVALENGMVLDLKTLSDRREELAGAGLDAQFDAVSQRLSDESIRSANMQVARAAGLPIDGNLSNEKLFELIEEHADLDSTTRAALTNARTLWQASQREGISRREATMFAERAETVMAQAEKLIVDSKIAVLPASQQPAATEYYSSRNGTVQNPVNAMTAFTEHAAYSSQGGAGTPFHDAGVAALKSVLSSSDTAVTTASITDPAERVTAVLRQDQNFDVIAGQMMGQAVSELYVTTATLMQDEQVLAMLNNPGSQIYNPQGMLDEQLLFNFLATRPKGGGTSGAPPDLEAYVARLRQTAPDFFQSVVRPQGPMAVIQASMNKVFFENNAASYMTAELERRLRAGVRNVTNAQQQAARREREALLARDLGAIAP